MKRFQNQKFTNQAIAGQIFISDKFKTDKNLICLWKKFHPTFYAYFNQAFYDYKQGDWESAKQNFHQALLFKADDYPTLKLLEVMDHYPEVPSNWDGVRDFESGH